MFDQLVNAKYLNEEDKTCVLHSGVGGWATAISNNILRTGKHYVTFETYNMSVQIGVMRPGKATSNANGLPTSPEFYQNFTERLGQGGEHVVDNNSIRCCILDTIKGWCVSSNWYDDTPVSESWEGFERTLGNNNLGMLLDLDEGTLSVYTNGRKLGVMKSGLVGPYCWMVSLFKGEEVTIKRGTVPPRDSIACLLSAIEKNPDLNTKLSSENALAVTEIVRKYDVEGMSGVFDENNDDHIKRAAKYQLKNPTMNRLTLLRDFCKVEKSSVSRTLVSKLRKETLILDPDFKMDNVEGYEEEES